MWRVSVLCLWRLRGAARVRRLRRWGHGRVAAIEVVVEWVGVGSAVEGVGLVACAL